MSKMVHTWGPPSNRIGSGTFSSFFTSKQQEPSYFFFGYKNKK